MVVSRRRRILTGEAAVAVPPARGRRPPLPLHEPFPGPDARARSCRRSLVRAVETQSFPDPALTANLYCAGGLDETFFRVVAPFWRELRLQDPERLCSLWVVRCGRRGEHLKIRVHGPGSLLLGQRELLARRAGAFFASLPA